VTGDSRRWQGWAAAPQRAAPEALLAAYPESVTRLRLPCTWRLGPRTTALIQPAFYAGLPFTSARPPRYVEVRGTVVPELAVDLVAPLAGSGDPCLAATAAARVHDLLDGGLIVEDGQSTRPLEPGDVAVITPHVEQASAVAARLANRPAVLIGTANQAQGLEREAVVVIHPLTGYRDAPAFAIDPGRLCVALSRHRSHATVICDVETDNVLWHAQAEAPNDTAVAIQRHVLKALLGTS
jgi:AAA domain